MRFPWDNNTDDSEKLSAKEIRQRFEEVKRKMGMEV